MNEVVVANHYAHRGRAQWNDLLGNQLDLHRTI
jgi:hypothetical protein